MRVFIGVDLPEKIRKKLEEIQLQIGTNSADIRFVKPDKMHFTLKFFGEISSIKVERVKERLKGISFKNFELNLTKLGVFPNDKFIKVVWVGLKPERKVKKLLESIEERLRDMFEIDKRFKAHLTLGRVNFVKDKELFLKGLNDVNVESEFTVKNFKLIKSELTNGSREYKTLEVFE